MQRNPIRKQSSNAALLESRQRTAMRKRDFKDSRPHCRFEKLVNGQWKECGKKTGSILCHIIRRPHLNEACKFHPDMVLAGCDDCHKRYDAYLTDVRVPYSRAVKAWYVATVEPETRCKVAPPARYNPLENSLYWGAA